MEIQVPWGQMVKFNKCKIVFRLKFDIFSKKKLFELKN